MPKRKDINSILIIGAGPIIIGQACEFDYSGAQACKALKEEGFRVILVNSNPATIMTDPLMADATYIEHIHWESVKKIIEKEIEVEKIIEKPIYHDRIVHVDREVPKETIVKEMVYVPLPTDDAELLKKGPFKANEFNEKSKKK